MNRETRYKEIIAQAPKLRFELEAFRPQIEMLTVFSPFPTDVLDDEGKRIGFAGGGTGYTTVLCHGEEWLISHKDLWFAFEKAWKEAQDDQKD